MGFGVTIEELTARRLILLRKCQRWGASRCRRAIADRAERDRVTLEIMRIEHETRGQSGCKPV